MKLTKEQLRTIVVEIEALDDKGKEIYFDTETNKIIISIEPSYF